MAARQRLVLLLPSAGVKEKVLLIRLFRSALPRAASALFAAGLVVSCATSTEPSQSQGRNPATAADVNIERVVLQAYRAIGDRHLFEPNFRNLSARSEERRVGKEC